MYLQERKQKLVNLCLKQQKLNLSTDLDTEIMYLQERKQKFLINSAFGYL